MRAISFFLLFVGVLITYVGYSHNVMKTITYQVDNDNQIMSLFGVRMQGENQDEIIKNLIEQTDEFEYYEKERTGIKRVMFCGVPCGLNLRSEQKEGTTIITSIALFTSLQDKATFDTLKNAVSKRYGIPELEEYEGGPEEIDGRVYGKCRWNNSIATLRNVNTEEGGFFLFLPCIIQGEQGTKE